MTGWFILSLRGKGINWASRNCKIVWDVGSTVWTTNRTSGYFVPSHFWRRISKRWKHFFFSKKHSFLIIYSNFSNVQSLLFLPEKNIKNGRKERFSETKTFQYAFHSSFATFGDFEKSKFFRKLFKKVLFLFFRKKTQVLNFSRFFTISVALYGKFATFRSKNFMIGEVNKLADVAWAQLAIVGLKKFHFRWRFCFLILKNMAQNIKSKTVRMEFIQGLPQYIREALGHKERKGNPRIVWRLEETVSKL